VAGVLAGVARRLGVSTTGVRIAFLVSMLFPGPQFLLYAVGWILMPREGG
jgi:phage shock protein PspC (stress-responsive transcriptional regulator)